jgi:hypothetical protein
VPNGRHLHLVTDLHDSGNDFADNGGHHEPDDISGENDDRDAEERDSERSGAKRFDLHGTKPSLLEEVRRHGANCFRNL